MHGDKIFMGKLLIILVVIFSLPLAYIQYFIFIELPKKIGYLKFCLILFCHIVAGVMAVQLLMEDYLNLLTFYLFFVAGIFIEVYVFLRKEFIADIKGLFGRK